MSTFEDGSLALFESTEAWELWLSEHHASAQIVWLQIAKKGTPTKTVTYDEALDVALCFGWIDGQRKGHDEQYFLQRFTRRRKNSLWSKRNVVKVMQLVQAEKVRAAGLAEIEAAQADGRWQRAYDSSKTMAMPDDFLAALQENAQAQGFFSTLNKTNLFAIGFRLQTAKTLETRQKRIEAILKRLENGQGFS